LTTAQTGSLLGVVRVQRDIARGTRGQIVSTILMATWLLVSTCLVCSGQTNSPVAAGHADNSSQTKLTPSQSQLFPPPDLKLHDLPFKQEAPSDALPHRTVAYSGQMDSEISPGQAALFRRIEQAGELKPPAAGTDFERKMDAAFKPKIIHIGHVKIYSPIATAIARKNPFCLLDPMVLGISF
jgi:hypothetical protein